MNRLSTDRFTPIRGTEASILASTPTKGYVWFATDTKKIYYSDGESFISMGGNSSIFYGKMILAETPDDTQTIFDFQLLEIDGNTDEEIMNTPNVDDLILNIPDGCFYRVVEVNEESVAAQKLTIAGSGSGGGSGGDDITSGAYTFNRIGKADITSLYQHSCSVSFKYIATDAQGESTGNAKGAIRVNGISKSNFTARQGDNTIEIGEFLDLGENRVEIVLTLNTGGSDFTVTKRWTVTTVSVDLTWDYDETQLNYVTNNLTFYWSVTGNVMKTTHIVIDDLYQIDSDPTVRINTQDITIPSNELNNYGLGHGAHKVEMYVTAQIDDDIIRTESTYKYIMMVDVNNKTPIISCNFINTDVIQYNTAQIPIIIYNPEAKTGTSTVTLREDTELKDTWNNVVNCELNYWAYTPISSGEKILTILCNNEERRLILNVSELDIDNKEVGGYAFKFKATDFSSNNAIQNWESNGITLTTSENFDWINGGLQSELDENNEMRQYVCIKAGTTMTINYKMFAQNAGLNGKVCKIIFKATRCRDFDAQVLKCYNDSTNIGLLLRAQDAIYKSEQATIKTAYCEDSYLEFETDIWKNPSTPVIVNGMDVSQRYIMTWLDGVPCGAAIYATNDSFVNDEYITIGSNDCDVYLYLIKVYERHLNNEEHLSNFIADSSNAKDMLDRFKRNDILDDRGEISYLKLAKANPDCLVHLYEVDHVSTHKKKDIVNGCSYIQYHGSDEAVMTAQNVTMKVQGTSSAKYGVAAFNLDTKFNDGFDLADGTHIKKWAMTEDAIPVNYFTNKVNVASCEQANNALNQEYYNRFQPYICKYRRKNPKARDTMQFTPGVMFILDHNQLTDSNERDKNNVFKDTPGYVNEPYFKMYSICNMGNSKKNTEVFHDVENPLECCVEVTDNQTKGQWMTEIPAYIQNEGDDDPTYVGEITTGSVVEETDGEGNVIGMSITGLTAEEYAQWDLACSDAAFEFRHPDGDATDSHKAAFFRFLRWMSLNDPSEKYEQIIVNNETDFNKRISGYYADEENQKDWVDPTSLYIEEEAAVGVTHTEVFEYEEGQTYYIISSHPHGYTNEALPEPVTFGSYTFSNSEFTQKLKGLTISTYAGTYDTDCYKYRMAKMLSECEDYLIMDAVVFHYLFIERHTLIDNVAKNTFWSTEDLLHWGPLKDYDNDTADGNDNQGKLTLKYGYEALDPIEDRYVFNAHQAVWLNFINGLQPACVQMYTALNSTNLQYGSNAWDAQPYLKLFEDWQNCIPERIWIECYYRLYLRPREVYGAVEYMGMLEGGKKTHQRKQFETYQEKYIASKYTEGGSTIMIRGYGANVLNYAIPVTVYSDCYLRTNWGQQRFNKRVKRGEVNNILCPIDNINNATIYFHFAELFQTIGDLSGLFPDQFDSSAAVRLRELTLGGETVNNNLKNISFANNIQLEKLVVRNCPGVTIPLELNGAVSLKELDTRNSGFTGITIADGAPLEKLYLEAPSSLVLTNLKFVNNFTIASYNNISTLYLDNIDQSPALKSKMLIDNSPNLSFYSLKNVDWLLDSPSELNLSDKTVNILERLLSLQGKDTLGNILPPEISLTGYMEVSDEAYDDGEAFEFYDKYAQDDIYPNLDIDFTGTTAHLHTIKIYNGNDELYWSRKITDGEDLDSVFLSEGPNGAYDPTKIIKSPTVSTTFSFANSWSIYDIEGELVDILNEAEPYFENVNGDLIFKPIFTSNTRTYQIKFYNGSDWLNSENYVFEHGTILKNILPKTLPNKSDEGLPLERTNAFIGYGLTENSPTVVNENISITDNMTLYALFTEKSVYENCVGEQYLTFILSRDGQSYSIRAKDGILFTGKITLPIVHPQDGKEITGIANYGFQNQNFLTHVFWEKKAGKTNKVATLGIQAFQQCENLNYFEMPELVTTIPSNGFKNCYSLFKDLDQEYVDEFFGNITEIESFGCNLVGTSFSTVGLNTVCKLSANLTTLQQACLAATGFMNFQIGSPGNPSQLNYNACGEQIFSNTYIQENLSLTIYADNNSLNIWNDFKENKFGLNEGYTYSVLNA